MSMRPTSQRTAPKSEFKAKSGSKPGAVAKANRADKRSDKAIAKQYGVKSKG